MTTADLIAYRTLPAGMREAASLMSAQDLTNTFIQPAIVLSRIAPTSQAHGGSVLVLECFSEGDPRNGFAPTDIGQLNGFDDVTSYRDPSYLMITLGAASLGHPGPDCGYDKKRRWPDPVKPASVRRHLRA